MSTELENQLSALEPQLIERSGGQCELCESKENLKAIAALNVPPAKLERAALVCEKCANELQGETIDVKHWFCLNTSVWTQEPGVQILVYRMLKRIGEDWSNDLFDQIYLEDEVRKDAESWFENQSGIVVKDSNGTVLSEGDSVTLIKDLDVKGAGFTAKRGTVVRSIHLGDDPGLIEGKVNGTAIYLKTEFLKKV